MRTKSIAAFAAFALAAAAARAQVCGGSTGPDLVIGGVSGPANYTASGGLDACAFGVTLCNFGTQTVVVSFSNNNHPLVVQNLYRYEVVNGASRFEQIGMSWAWNSSFLLEQNGCCTCTAAGNGNLGPGCSSPSTGNALGTQAGQSPRSDVDFFSGAFVFPPSNPPFSGSVARRLQFALADVDPGLHPSAQFFVEEIAISPGDASAGNGPNNASYAPVSVAVASGNATLALAGSIVRAQPAIYAWQALDPSVIVTSVQAPGEGTFFVASRGTDLGTGSWRYEYAIENLNSNFACGAVRVSFPHASTTQVGFHDVDYHDGDGPGGVTIDATDWPATTAPGSVRWSTDAYAANPRANALRAGTLYAYRFDAPAPPSSGLVEVELWRTTGTLTASAIAPSLPPSAGSEFCSGDGSGTACPCGNQGLAGRGCGNSANAGGGTLAANGTPSLAQDTLSLVGDAMTNNSCLYFQGTTTVNGGAGSVFGDGLRCAGGAIVRLAIRTNAGGSSSYGYIAFDVPISQRGQVTQPGVRTYQAWYRDAQSFCTSSTFNLTNGVSIAWTP